ncbi:MAG: hypothetical protein KIT16_04850 [Rhodospirillaceae bacterium]|nr:hypothetical protein [Rhodospirillaceae bacterium]
MENARGIISWFASEPIKEPGPYLEWLDKQTGAGKRYVMIGDIGFASEALESITLKARFDRIMARIGIAWRGSWVTLTYAKKIVIKNPAMVEFERHYPRLLPPYARTDKTADATSYFAVARIEESGNDDLVVIGPGGGYIAGAYAALLHDTSPIVRAWYVDPFRFFREAFATDDLPKPDTTTMSGRRIYYSHIDGDGWLNITGIEAYANRKITSAEVVLDEVIAKYPDLPVTVAPISGDLDPSWYGDAETQEIARRMFSHANVEAGSHTHSHPFAWAFFHPYDAKRESRYLYLYPPRPGHTLKDSVFDPGAIEESIRNPPAPVEGVYDRPRSYALKPFDIALEIAGSVEIIQRLVPAGKRVEILQWSGDVTPWADAVARTAALKLRNINGGDSRMDGTFDSYAWVAPLARRVGDRWQVYSSSANENVYTDTWRRRFYAFRTLVESLRNTETPIRVKPINVYYHFYSAERPEGLRSLQTIFAYARAQQLAPVATSRFAAMVDGFLGARIVSLGERSWRIENRDGLETIRFDHASLLAVDFAKSEGIVGQRHYQGSLYVALDAAEPKPVITLKEERQTYRDADAAVPYLVEARWRVKNVERGAEGWSFDTDGFGAGEFVWKVPAAGRYRISWGSDAGNLAAVAETDGLLRFTIPAAGEDGIEIHVRREVAPP